MDSLFRGSDGHHLLRGAVRLRPGPGRGRGDEQVSYCWPDLINVCLSVSWYKHYLQVISGDNVVSELSIAAISRHRTIILRSRHLNPRTNPQFITVKCMFLSC